MDSTTRSHHHTTTDGVERVRSKTGTGGDTPTEKEGSKEVALERTDEDDGFNGVVLSTSKIMQHCKSHQVLTETEVETTVDNDTDDGGNETTV